jgi:hypothetical protein
VRRRMLSHEVGGDEHGVVRERGHWKCAGDGVVVCKLGSGGRLGGEGRRSLGSVCSLAFCV